MDVGSVITALFGLVGVIVGAGINKSIANRENYHNYITKERQKWREDIRSYVEELYKSDCDYDYKLLKTKFEVRLNPNDEYDKKILTLFDKLIKTKDNKIKGRIVTEVSHLLKYDWERVKREAGTEFKPYRIAYAAVLYWILVSKFKCNPVVWMPSIVIVTVLVHYCLIGIRRCLERSECGKCLLKLVKYPVRTASYKSCEKDKYYDK